MRFWPLFGVLAASFLLLLAASVRPAWAPGVLQPTASETAALDADTRRWLTRSMAARGIPGLSVAIVIDGKVAAVDAFGSSDYWAGTPMTPDTLVEVASNSKVVVGLAATRAVAAGTMNLDQPLAEYHPDFSVEGDYANAITLEMLLTHTAGLDNALGRTPRADQPPDGEFRYSGAGFELAGALLAHDAGTDLPSALRESVLTPLGVSDGATYGPVGDSGALASPHVTAVQPLLMFTLPCLLVFVVLNLLAWLAAKIRLWKTPDSFALLSLWVSMGMAVVLPIVTMSHGNAMRVVLLDLIFVAAMVVLVTAVRAWLRSRSLVSAVLSAVIAGLLSVAVFRHMPVPLEERAANSPAAAGLRASARDMGHLLAAIVNPPARWEENVSELTAPRVRVNDENEWGLGIGIQGIDDSTVVWHWGINYPGYQSLMLGVPATADGLVVLMNGGAMLIAPGGSRWVGLELARELAARVLPVPHGAYWHGVQ